MSDCYYVRPIGAGSTYSLLDSNADIRPNPNLQFKVVIVGDSGCGKTSLFTSFIRGYFPTDYEPTIFENHRAFVQNQGNEILTVDLWDTAGQEDYERLRRLSYQDANLVILAYSLASKESLLNIPEVWAPEIINFCPNVPILLVGLKSDLPDHKVDPFDALKVAENIGAVAHMQCSAKEMYNVGPLFDTCFNIIYNMKMRKTRRRSNGSLSPTKRASKRFSGHFRTHSKQNSITLSLSSITENRRKKKLEREEEREKMDTVLQENQPDLPPPVDENIPPVRNSYDNAYSDAGNRLSYSQASNNDYNDQGDYNGQNAYNGNYNNQNAYNSQNAYNGQNNARNSYNAQNNQVKAQVSYNNTSAVNNHTTSTTSRKQAANSYNRNDNYQIAQPNFGYDNNYTEQEEKSKCCVIM